MLRPNETSRILGASLSSVITNWMTVTMHNTVPHTWNAKPINSMNSPRIQILRLLPGASEFSVIAGAPAYWLCIKLVVSKETPIKSAFLPFLWERAGVRVRIQRVIHQLRQNVRLQQLRKQLEWRKRLVHLTSVPLGIFKPN